MSGTSRPPVLEQAGRMTKEQNVGLGTKFVVAAVTLGVLSSPSATASVLSHAQDAFDAVRDRAAAEIAAVTGGTVPGVRSATTAARPAVTGRAGYRFTVRDRHGRPARWNPCAPIPILVNLRNAPEHAMRDLKTAVRHINRASGLAFKVVGTTTAPASSSWGMVEWSGAPGQWAPVHVAFGAPGTGDLAADGSSGVASPVWVGNGDAEVFVSAAVVFNSRHNDRYLPGFGAGPRRGELFEHELGHVAGLDHVNDPRQIMYDEVGHADRLGAGDKQGLARLGAGGCVEVPAPAWAH